MKIGVEIFLNFLLDFSLPKWPISVVKGEKKGLGIFLNFLLDFFLPKSVDAGRKIGLGIFLIFC